ncbi:hypothetical protein K3495_g6907 [Podosphaera aphanis]|nr:hypothetical protein K3495_g6907 [Podosphaera aphanis]
MDDSISKNQIHETRKDLTNPQLSSLPHPRHQPLRAGSGKEDTLRRYLESKFLHISRRYAKKFLLAESGPNGDGDVKGYMSMSEAAQDLSELLDVVWLSGTPSLQIPNFLQIAGMINTFVVAFPPVPEITFLLLQKLDHIFASLLTGNDIVTGERLPGFTAVRDRVLSKTDMVRLKSLVEDTRVLAVDLLEKLTSTQGIGEAQVANLTDESGKYDMKVAQIYVQTVDQLGRVMDPMTYQSHRSE